ncbi:TrkA family potassium uptake protein [Desulfovibrio sp. UCD-KL4C]|uniref:potassium channel family protein n=1 Tax=Desulfovibrio sp. UCD-KL4C TaxID=2578120 RepID=UPI0025C02DA7|nr:potassium channel protein [Desulfovibrio sp. UCD-KL4C]
MKSKSVYVRMLNLRREFGIFWGVAAGCIYMLLVFIGGILGYMWIEGWNFLNSFYMVVITLSTVGFMEVLPLSENGRIMTSLLILGGVGGFAYLIGAFSQLLVEGRLQAILGRRRMQNTIGKFKNHIIVCGYGRIGAIVAEEVLNEGLDLVVIESDPDLIVQMEAAGITCLEGDATKDGTLKLAGLDRAKSLITALSDEAANVYVTLIARQFSSKVNIIARGNNKTSISRLEFAGADRVVLPHTIGGIRMAQSVLRPTVTNFLDIAIRGKIDLQMEELFVTDKSEFVGQDLIESQIRPRFNLIIIAIRKNTGDMVFNPGPKEVIESRDTLLTVGKISDLSAIQKIL